MPNHTARCPRGIIDCIADAITLTRLTILDWICGPYPETETDRLRAPRLRRLVEEGRALGLLDAGEDEVTLAWHEARRQFRMCWCLKYPMDFANLSN
jgi:hypothetical protein